MGPQDQLFTKRGRPVPMTAPRTSALIALSVLGITATALSQRPKVLSTPEIVKREAPSIVRIDVLDESQEAIGQATGVILKGDGVIVTNFHVFQSGCDAVVATSWGNKAKITHLLFSSKEMDLALIRVAGEGLRPATIGRSVSLVVGQKLIAIGNPMGLDQTVSEGIVSGKRKVGSETFIQTTAPISPGSSGGGLYTEKGELVGITTFTLRESQNLNFAIPIDTVTSLLSNGQLREVEWSLARAGFCEGNIPRIDFAVVIGLIGRRLGAEVQAALRELNGGKEPSYTVDVSKYGQSRIYMFPRLGVEVIFADGVAHNVLFNGHKARFLGEFGGDLPLGLRWRMTRDEVHQQLGSQRGQGRSGDPLSPDPYVLGRFVYVLHYGPNDELQSIDVVQALDQN